MTPAVAGVAGRHERTFVAMGTRMRLVAHGDRAAGALADAECLVRRLEALLSRYRPDSDVIALTRGAGGWVAVHPHTDAMLRAALDLARRTGGLCDPVLGALVDLWAPARCGAAPPPDDRAVARSLARCGYHLLERRDGPAGRGARYRLARGARVDLGAVGKGYAAQQVAGLLRRRGVASALVACGASSIAAVGGRPDGTPWRVGLRAPLDDGLLRSGAAVPIADEHLSVSGDDVPSAAGAGVPGAPGLGHVLDPRTGRPAAGDLRAAAVVAADGTVAEALSTAMLVAGATGALDLCRRWSASEAVDAVLVRSDGRVLTSGRASVHVRADGAGGTTAGGSRRAG